jgi:hypothetical protein
MGSPAVASSKLAVAPALHIPDGSCLLLQLRSAASTAVRSQSSYLQPMKPQPEQLCHISLVTW